MKTKFNLFASPTIALFVTFAQPIYADINGVNDNVMAASLGNSGSYSLGTLTGLGGDLTVEAWVYLNAYANWERVVDLGNGATSNNIILATDGTSGKPVFNIYNGGTSIGNVVASSALPLNTWVHVAGVVQADRTMLLYVNGAQVASGTASADVATLDRTSNYIGRSNWGSDALLNGSVSDVRIWNSARTQAEIQNNMNVGAITGPTTGLVAAYEFGSTGSNPTADISGNGYTATQSGAITYQKLDTGTLTTGGFTGASTNLNVAQGALNLTGTNSINAITLNSGDMTQSSGTVTTLGSSTTAFEIGQNSGTNSSFNISGGSVTLSSSGGLLRVGSYGTGTLNQTGGTVNTNHWAVIGRFAGGSGTYNISSGAFNCNSYRILVGEEGTGVLNVSGDGAVTAVGGIALGWVSGGVGTVNLNGGTIVTADIVKGSGSSATFNFNGGTLKASGNNASFMSGLNSATIQSGGAKIDDGGYAITIGQAMGGTGALTKSGTGNLTLSGSNTYNGGTTVNAGTLTVATTNGLASNAGNTVTVNNGGTLTFSANDVFGIHSASIDSPIVINAGGLLQNSGAVFSSLSTLALNGGTLKANSVQANSGQSFGLKGAVTVNGSVTSTIAGSGIGLGEAAVTGTTFDVKDGAAATDLNVTGVLRDGGTTNSWPTTQASSLTKTGAGTMVLAGVNTYTGGTTVNGGTLSVTAEFGLANTASNTLTVNNGGTATFAVANVFGYHNATVNTPIVVNAGGLLQNSGTTFNVVGALSLNGGTLQANSVDAASGQSFGLKGTVTVNGSATSTIAGNGIALGQASVTGTTFDVKDGAAATDLMVSGALRDGVGGTWPNTQASTLTKAGAGKMVLAGASTYTGGTTVSAGTLALGAQNILLDAGALTVTGGTFDLGGFSDTVGAVTLSGGAISNGTLTGSSYSVTSGSIDASLAGAGALTKSGVGSVTLSGTNSYSGGTTVSAGTLALGAQNVLADAGALTVTGGTFDLGGYSDTVGAVSLSGGAINNGTLTGSSYAVSSGSVGANLAGAGALAKTGVGTVTLSGSNSYLGGTTVSAGTLALGAQNVLADAGALTVTGGTFDLGGFSDTVGAVSLSGGAINNGTLTGSSYAVSSGSIGANLAGTGILTKTGSGTVTLSGTNSYSGGTTVSGGSLTGTTSSLQQNITNNATVTFDQSTAGTYGGNMSGTGVLVKSGTGTVTLAGSNTYSGGTTVSAGALIGTTSSIQGAVANNTSVTLSQDTAGTYAGIMSGSGALVKSGTGTVTLTGANTYSGGTTVSAGNLVGTTSSLRGTIVDNATVTFDQPTNSSYSSVISGTGVLVKSGAGLLYLNGANSYSGGTVVNGGILQLYSDAQLGASSGGITLDGGLIYNTDSVLTLNANRTITLGAGGGSFGAGWYRTLTVAGQITGSGGLGVDFNGGTILLSGSNNYTGTTTIGTTSSLWYNAIPTLKLGSASALPSGNALAFGTTVNNTTAILDLNSYATTVGLTTGSSNAVIDNTAAAATTLTLSPASGSANYGGAIRNSSGAISLVKSGAGTQMLSGSLTYTGATTVNSGTLDLVGGTAISTFRGSSVAISSDTTFQIDATGAGSALGQFFTGNAQFGQYTNSGAPLTLTGTGTFLVTGGTSDVLALGNLSGNVIKMNFSQGALIDIESGAMRNGGWDAVDWTNNNASLKVATGAKLQLWGAGSIVRVDALTGGGTIGTRYDNSSPIIKVGVANGSGTFSGTLVDSLDGASNVTSGLTKEGTGTQILSGTNTYSGATTISAGILQIGDGSTTGALGSGAVSDNAALSINRSNAYTISNVISGSGTLTQTGGGTTTLTGANTYSGTTTLSAGILQIGSGGTTGALGSGAVTNNAALSINRSNAYTISNAISGSGSLTQVGSGTTTLSGSNSYTGGTTVSGGSLIGTTSSLQQNITNNATVTVDQSTAGTYGGNMSGTGALVKSGTGTVTLAGANTYSGGTTVSAGRLVGTTSSLQGAVTNNANVTLDQAVDGSYAGVMSGTGALLKSGTGSVTLAGANTYSGGTTVSAGKLVGTTSSIRGAVTNNAAVEFDQSSDGTYSGSIGGTGSLAKSGSGKLVLNNNFSYIGATTVTGGSLFVNGDISASSLTTIKSSAILGGSGTLGALMVEAGGTVAPGNSPGILSTGNYNQAGTLSLQLDGLIVGTSYDQIKVTGSVTLSGQLEATVGYTPVNDQLLFILSNDGIDAISGTFSGIADQSIFDLGGYQWKISYSANYAGSNTGTFTGGNDIALLAVPEPSAWVLLGLSALGLAVRRRR